MVKLPDGRSALLIPLGGNGTNATSTSSTPGGAAVAGGGLTLSGTAGMNPSTLSGGVMQLGNGEHGPASAAYPAAFEMQNETVRNVGKLNQGSLGFPMNKGQPQEEHAALPAWGAQEQFNTELFPSPSNYAHQRSQSQAGAQDNHNVVFAAAREDDAEQTLKEKHERFVAYGKQIQDELEYMQGMLLSTADKNVKDEDNNSRQAQAELLADHPE
ncbi:unnamed protein product, partial [Amoebophrya sp. A120]|eukprot:GSA120T00018187001.1